LKIAVFVDGCFWHSCPIHGSQPKANAGWWMGKLADNRRRDADTNQRLRRAGWLVTRVWEHESPADAADHVASIVAGRRSQLTKGRGPEHPTPAPPP
jgi:DNA mismatch endonuclease (patch repair protein)